MVGRKEGRKCKGCHKSGEFFILLDDVVGCYLLKSLQTNKLAMEKVCLSIFWIIYMSSARNLENIC